MRYQRSRSFSGFGPFGPFGMRFFPPFGFSFQVGGFPRRSEYLEMLENYRRDLQEELQWVEQEIADLRGEERASASGPEPGGPS